MGTLITYKIVSDRDGKLWRTARQACNFWNRFLAPEQSVVMRLGTFTANNRTIARAYRPTTREGVVYGQVEFNTKYIETFSDNEIITTIIHELGHTLGMGWNRWMRLFSRWTGKFYQNYIDQLPALADMEVELDGGPGTELAHWDEKKFDRELMTGYKDAAEYVLPVTIEVFALLGHEVLEKLRGETALADILQELEVLVFSRQKEAEQLDRDYYEEMPIWEEIFI